MEPARYEDYYVAATRVRTIIAEEFYKAFESDGLGKVDCILQPVTPFLPGKTGETNKDSVKAYESDLYTLLPNIAGLPGFSFRAGYSDAGPEEPRLPVGLQLIGPRWSDDDLLDIGFELEKVLGVPKIAAL
jgi:aspartyl-tRNA(Asn)/glutamyl-tRNA(Gln) amidotransferase subunit A